VRTRELGIEIGVGTPGLLNAITDVAGVAVGHATLIEGHGPLVVGEGPIRTGVTVIKPHAGIPAEEPLFAGFHSLNGNGEVTGLLWLKESGQLTSPIGLTNSHSVGVVRDTLAAIESEERHRDVVAGTAGGDRRLHRRRARASQLRRARRLRGQRRAGRAASE